MLRTRFPKKHLYTLFCLLLAALLSSQSLYRVNPKEVHQIIAPLADGPEKLDSLAKYVQRLFLHTQIDSAEKYADQGLALAQSLDHNDQIARFLLAKSRCLNARNQAEAAIAKLLEAETFAKKDSSKYLSSIYVDMTKVYGLLNQGDSLAYYYEKAKAYNDQHQPYANWKLEQILFNQNKNLGNETQAWKYLNNAYQLTKEFGDRMDFGFMIQIKKEYAAHTQNWEELAAVLVEEQALYKKDKKRLNGVHQILADDKGLSILEQKNKYERLIQYFDQFKYLSGLAEAKLKYAQLLIEENDSLAAIPFLQSAARLFEQQEGNQIFLEENYKLLIQALKKENRFSEALQVSQQLLALKSNMQIINKNKVLLELESKYTSQKKSDSLAILQAENLAKDSRLSKSSQQKYFLIVGLLGLSIFSFFLYSLYRKNQQKQIILQAKNQKIAESLKDREFLIQEVHHRVKNNLQLVSSLLSMQSRHIEDFKAKEALVDGQNRVQSMALIHQNLYKENDLEGVNFKNYIQLICQNLKGSFDLKEDTVRIDVAVESVILDVNTAVSLGIIINELVTNSFKYAFPDGKHAVISISANRIGQQIKLVVKDNGIGMDLSNIKEGFGNRLIRMFAKKLEASWEVTQDQGTVNTILADQFKILREA